MNLKEWLKDFFSTPGDTRRRGLIHAEGIGVGLLNKGTTYKIVIEIREIETVKGLTHFEVIKVSGNDDIETRNLIPEWIETSRIDWID